jgi:hypothetical protein
MNPPILHTHILLNIVEEEEAGISWEVSNTATLFRMWGELWTEKCSIFFVRVDYGLDYRKTEI